MSGVREEESEMEAAGLAPLNLVVRLWHAPAHALMRGFSLRGRFALFAILWLFFLAVIAGEANASTPVFQIRSDELSFANITGVEPVSVVPDRLIVKFRGDATPGVIRDITTRALGREGRVIYSYRNFRNLQVVKLPPGVSVEKAMKIYRSLPYVEYVSPVYRRKLLYEPDDPLYPNQWGLRETRANYAWDISTGSAEVAVVVVDTGINYTHEDLSGNIWKNPGEVCDNGIDDDGNGYVDDCYGVNTYNLLYGGPANDTMDYNGHGTHVAGIIGAVGNNSLGVAGVNWNVSLISCTAGSGGFLTDDAIVLCLDYAVDLRKRGVNVVATSNSYGGYAPSDAVYDAIRNLMRWGILFIAAAGNNGVNNDYLPSYPASYSLPNIIAVAASNQTGSLADFSNYGTGVHVAAPGAEILSTYSGSSSSYKYLSGTSMAAPFVTGTAALLRAYNSSLRWWEIRNLILAGAGDRGLPVTTGGVVDVYSSITCSNSSFLGILEPKYANYVSSTASLTLEVKAIAATCSQPLGVYLNLSYANGTQILSMPLAGDGTGISNGSITLSSPGDYRLTYYTDSGLVREREIRWSRESIDSCPSAVVAPGTYHVARNISAYSDVCIAVLSDDVVVDGGGYTLRWLGAAPLSISIVAPSVRNVSVSDIGIENWVVGVLALNSSGIRVLSGRLDNTLAGVGVVGNAAEIADTLIYNSTAGVVIFGDNNTVSRSKIVGSHSAGAVMVGLGNAIEDSRFEDGGGLGVLVTGVGNVIARNMIINNSLSGIFAYYIFNSTITGNVIERNAVGLQWSVDYDRYNLIYNNIFNNSVNTYISTAQSGYTGTNYWNTTLRAGTNIVGGAYIGGNYWGSPSGNGYSDTCGDGNGDGICDAPYVIGIYNDTGVVAAEYDYLPLAYSKPAGMPEFPAGVAPLVPLLLALVTFFKRRTAILG